MTSSPRPPTSGDVLSGPADYTRPANPWPRLIAFGLVVLGSLFLVGVCFSSFVSTPDREIRVRDSEYTPGVAKHLPIIQFGADEDRRTYGGYLAVSNVGSRALAFFSRSPDTGCNLEWNTTLQFAGVTGIFIDPCSNARFDFAGVALHEDATRDLHRFAVRRETNSYVVSFEELTLGACRNGHTEACSPPGQDITRSVPRSALSDEFGNR